MNKKQVNARLGWLSLTLASKRISIAKLLLRLKDVGTRVGSSLGLQRKFIALLEQIAYDREIEKDILNDIEEVEKLHSEMKQRKMLRQASTLDRTISPQPAPGEEAAPKPPKPGLSTLFGLLLLFSPRAIKHKKQDLTVD